jgi:hypothetical protein
MSCCGAGVGRDRPSKRGGVCRRPPAGLKILIPGYPQWDWLQRERALVLFGSYLIAVGVGLFAWGTPIGLVVLAFAYGTHVASATDVVRQQAFPGFGRWVPMISASGGLGLGIYVPALTVATLIAWPGMGSGLANDGYLVNCWAYRTRPPQRGDWVWLRPSPRGEERLGRVVAGPGQEVEWSGDQIRVDGRRPPPGLAWRPRHLPVDLMFTVPRDHALIVPASSTSVKPATGSPILIAQDRILGRVWARLYPIRERQFLP